MAHLKKARRMKGVFSTASWARLHPPNQVYVERGEGRTPSFKQVAPLRLPPTLPYVLARRFDKQDS